MLWRWSIEDPAAFWSPIWDCFGVPGDRGLGARAAVPGGRAHP